MSVLVAIPYSPWSRRVHFALRHMGAAFRVRWYTPTLSEPRLRVALRRPVGPITVPVLLRDDGPHLTEGLDIVRWGAAGSARPLITAANDAEIARWSGLADRLAEAGRVRTTERVLRDRAALSASLPEVIRGLGPVGRMIGRDAARRLLRKYGHLVDGDPHGAMEEVLDAVQAALGTVPAPGSRFLVGDSLTYADVAVAHALDFVLPHVGSPLRGAAREAWTERDLADRYTDVLVWRDGVLG